MAGSPSRLGRAAVVVLLAFLLAGCGGGGGASPATLSFHSRPDLRPPVVDVHARTDAASPGYVFIAPKKSAPQQGPEILDDRGQPIWFGPLAAQATDFRVQRYAGKPVLTYWEGPAQAPVLGTGLGHGVILDRHYREIARVSAGFGPETSDLHEFKLTPAGTALITAYRVVPYDLSALGGPKHGKLADSYVQEVVVATGKVIFSWHSLGHIALSESHAALPPKSGKGSNTPWDYFHVNSVDEEPDGNFLISARNTWGVYEIDRKTGDVLWRLGGKKSSFRMGPGTTFAWQHDARRQADGTITIFDDESFPPVLEHSRAIRLKLDVQTMSATLVSAYESPGGDLAGSQGNVQVLANGNTFVGWGAVPRFTEYDPSGKVVFDATFSKGDDSYRAYRAAWTGMPLTRPSIDAERSYGKVLNVWASWNGATQVAAWRVVAGTTPDLLKPVGGSAKKDGFETVLTVQSAAPLVAVQALDAQGRVLATSAAVPPGGRAIG